MSEAEGEIPTWSVTGVLPSVRPGKPGHSSDRSPYTVSLAAFVDHFGFSPERLDILEGLLQFRAELHHYGITSGFQWLDGSFLEQVELLEGRPPKDVDVVTLFHLPEGESQQSLLGRQRELFHPGRLKEKFWVDGYFHVLGEPTDSYNVRRITYWYSMWSHRRDGLWKGFLLVDLDPSQDPLARAALEAKGG